MFCLNSFRNLRYLRKTQPTKSKPLCKIKSLRELSINPIPRVFDNGVKWVVVAAEVEVCLYWVKKKRSWFFSLEWKKKDYFYVCYRLRSNTDTEPSLAEAPTLSPRLFQQISKIPPDPRYEWTNSPESVDQMWIHRSKLPEAINLPSGENDTL